MAIKLATRALGTLKHLMSCDLGAEGCHRRGLANVRSNDQLDELRRCCPSASESSQCRLGQNPYAMISGESATVRSSITPTTPIISSSPSPKLRPQLGCRRRRPTVVPSIYVGSLDAMAAIASLSHRCAASFSQRLCHAWTKGKLLSWNGSSPHCRLPWPKSSMLRLAAVRMRSLALTKSGATDQCGIWIAMRRLWPRRASASSTSLLSCSATLTRTCGRER